MDLVKILKSTQEELLQLLFTHLSNNGYMNNILYTNSYIFAKGEIPILLVAHLDTVHLVTPKSIFIDKEKNVMWSPEGIGGDDRCGVYAILEIIKEFKPYILFTTDEEVGGLGAIGFTNSYNFKLWEEIRYIVEIDRKGNNEAVFYDCGNKAFKDYILSFGFNEKFGTFSDISIISPDYDIASVNLSAGYYNAHTKEEYINLEHLANTINAVKLMLADTENKEFYDFQEKKWNSNLLDKGTPTNEYEDIFEFEDELSYAEENEDYYARLVEDWHNLTSEEFEEKHNMKRPKTIEGLWSTL